jgi:hypothetical protein
MVGKVLIRLINEETSTLYSKTIEIINRKVKVIITELVFSIIKIF